MPEDTKKYRDSVKIVVHCDEFNPDTLILQQHDQSFSIYTDATVYLTPARLKAFADAILELLDEKKGPRII